jgi:hypothetical protein
MAVSQNFENFFNQYGINESENIHAFSWFLNPNGSHGLKDIFLKELLTSSWSMIHGQHGHEQKELQNMNCYKNMTPLYIQQSSFMGAFVDRDMKQKFSACDVMISDIHSKTMVIINNNYDKTNCEKTYSHFNSSEYSYFENKLFITFGSEAVSEKGTKWMYMTNDWLINLCSTLIEGRGQHGHASQSYLVDFYQFLTGTKYGMSQIQTTEQFSTLISDYYSTLTSLKSFKAEMVPNKNLVEINPTEYASTYLGKISESEHQVLSLYWSYRNTFNTFFHVVELENITTSVEKMMDKKNYSFDRTFIRNGLCFSPVFEKVTAKREYIGKVFDIELVNDSSQNLTVSLVVNKNNWDKLNIVQKEMIQKNFNFGGVLSNDNIAIWSKYCGKNSKNDELAKEIIGLFDKVEMNLGKLNIQAA